ncbi:hypothetical protein [Streptomyces indicus]|uniref:hypothetical protein n=1 Tax=Streptomyces indicus TaxID=417292 RepID=UPI0015A1A8F1|nr:hypothetical protein [Streptomyces indicus]
MCAAALLLTLLNLLIEVAMVLFNAPKFVVSPHMGADPGALTRDRHGIPRG